MLKTPTAALATTLVLLLGGCTTPEPTQTASPTPPPSPTPTATIPPKPVTAPPEKPDPAINGAIQQYINKLAARGYVPDKQGVWIQSQDTLLANYNGTIPLSAASVTKVATTVAAIETFGPEHQFTTEIGINGTVKNGVLQGDLVVVGGEDPLFVWEEAIALGNTINKLGIKQITGHLIITGKFYMNFEFDPLTSGELLQQGLNGQNWPAEAETQYQQMPPGTPRPQITINGGVKVIPTPPPNTKPIIRHLSQPLGKIVKLMNMYSNNYTAQMLADSLGGAKAVAEKAAAAAGVPPAEIQLINGSGLGEENRLSPRAACGLFLALERDLKPYNMTVADIAAIVGQDLGVLQTRTAINLGVVKTGTLNNVSSIAGLLPNQKYGFVCIAVMNSGAGADAFRPEQDTILSQLLTQWGTVTTPPPELKPTPWQNGKTSGSQIINNPAG